MHQVARGDRIGRYRVVGTFGRGGAVIEVEDGGGGRYAMQSPVMDVEPTGEVTRRFAHEAIALQLLDHPNLVPVIDVFVEGGRLFLVSEKLVGRTITSAIPLAPRQVLVLIRQVLEGVGHAHTQGFVHRDLKPDNILLVDMGGWERVKIIDAGVARLVTDAAGAFGTGALTRGGIGFGAPVYMAPEQALGVLGDERADLYAVGVMLYEMLSGAPPFFAPDPHDLLREKARSRAPSLPGAAWCTPELLALVGIALAKGPAHRFATAAVMRAALDRAFASLDPF